VARTFVARFTKTGYASTGPILVSTLADVCSRGFDRYIRLLINIYILIN